MAGPVKYLQIFLLALLGIVIVVYAVRAFDSRRFPVLGLEHQIILENEFDASMEANTDWAAYLEIEEQLTLELQDKIDSATREHGLLDRYSEDSLTNPDNLIGNWNRSYELRAKNSKGVAVMLHGLSDSPYSMLSIAQSAVGVGYNVVVPRMPGHGFAVGSLLQARWQDWMAAMRIALRRADQLREPGEPLLLVGYSNGGMLAIDYALRCHDLEDMPCPDQIVLFSPAIDVTSAAMVTNLHKGISWLPYFKRFRWLSVLPEIDPFKFTSFPKSAAWEIHKLEGKTHALLDDKDRVAALPPILTFQSIVDNTVGSAAVISLLYDKLAANGSELVLYDLNRNDTLMHLMKSVPDRPIATFSENAPLNYNVEVLQNSSADNLKLSRASLAAGESEFKIQATDLEWPLGVYSLSHISLPFSPNDPIYGAGSAVTGVTDSLVLGAIAPRGEIGVLRPPPSWFLRTRYNPFFTYQVKLMQDWLRQTQ